VGETEGEREAEREVERLGEIEGAAEGGWEKKVLPALPTPIGRPLMSAAVARGLVPTAGGPA
jgi:hypothetical protein